MSTYEILKSTQWWNEKFHNFNATSYYAASWLHEQGLQVGEDEHIEAIPTGFFAIEKWENSAPVYKQIYKIIKRK